MAPVATNRYLIENLAWGPTRLESRAWATVHWVDEILLRTDVREAGMLASPAASSRLAANQHSEAAELHPGDCDAQRHQQQLDRDGGGQRPARRNRRQLLTHQEGNGKRQP